MELSRIKNVTEILPGEINYYTSSRPSYASQEEILTPFIPVFLIEGYEYVLMKRADMDYAQSFASEDEARQAALEFLKTFSYDAAIVFKTGNMQQIFRNVAEAEVYVAAQPKEWVSGNVQRRMSFGLNIYGAGYGSTDWEHFNIRLVKFGVYGLAKPA